MYRLIVMFAVGLLAAIPPARGQVPFGYEIVDVTSNPYYEPVPRINNRGQIVFTTWFDVSRRGTAEIFLYDDGELTRLTNDDVYDGLPDINDDGTIVWARGLGPIHPSTGEPSLEIVMWRNGQITRLTDNVELDFGPSINNLGQAVWTRSHEVSACGGPLSMEVDDFVEVAVRSGGIVVEEQESLRAHLAREIDRLVEGRMSPILL